MVAPCLTQRCACLESGFIVIHKANISPAAEAAEHMSKKKHISADLDILSSKTLALCCFNLDSELLFVSKKYCTSYIRPS